MWKNLKPQASGRRAADYEDYRFNGREWILYLLEGILLAGIISYFFYQSVWAFLFFLPVVPFFLKWKKKELAGKRRQELSVQFKDAVLSVSANQKAGYSVENAFREAYRDMAMLYGRDSHICKELNYIAKGLDNNMVLEKLLYELGVRSHVQDILQFADVFLIAKRTGGNMTEILSETANSIEEKSAVDKEIQVLLSSKKMEQKIMNVIPFFIIFYISITSKGFFDVLYHNLIGIVIMTCCLFLYLTAFMLSRKIIAIEV
ncbi:MAG: type II secretion system F family protein [Clostridium sp.]|nr:type II secretion system F family protein [Lachnoclostridium sp.]MCM1251317.1 type II secretion system F family protein [Clostridium sp.]